MEKHSFPHLECFFIYHFLAHCNLLLSHSIFYSFVGVYRICPLKFKWKLKRYDVRTFTFRWGEFWFSNVTILHNPLHKISFEIFDTNCFRIRFIFLISVLISRAFYSWPDSTNTRKLESIINFNHLHYTFSYFEI